MIMVVLLLSGCSLEENEKKEEIANINDFPKMYCKSYEHLKFESEILFEQKIITFCMNVWQNLINLIIKVR